MDDTEQRIRERAHRLWEEEGRPEGRELDHWEQARSLVGIEANPEPDQSPNPEVEHRVNGWASPPPPPAVEPVEAIEHRAEFPDRPADKGKKKSADPARRRSRGKAAKRA